MKKDIILLLILILLVIALSYIVDTTEKDKNIDLPKNYTLENYSVAEILTVSCKINSDCETPIEYLMRSSCPYTTLCLKKSCTVVCPYPKQ